MNSTKSEGVTISQRGMELVINRTWFITGGTIPITVFAVVWNGFLGFHFFNSTSIVSPNIAGVQLVSIIPAVIFLLAGIAIAYRAAVLWLNVTVLTISRSQMSVRHGPLPWPGNQVVSSVGIKRIHVVSSQLAGGPRREIKNYTFNLLAETADFQRTKLAGGFTRDDAYRVQEAIEKQWAIQQPTQSPANARVLDGKAIGNFHSSRPMEPTPANAAARKKTNADNTTLRDVIGIWIFVLLWNGSFWGVIWLIVTRPGAEIEWHKVALVSPFVLVGLGIIYVLMPWTLKFFRQRARAKPPANPNQVGELGLGPESVDCPIASSLLQPTEAPARNTAASDMNGSSVDRQPRSSKVRLGTFIYTRLFPLPFFVAGLVLLYLAGKDFNVAHESTQWPHTIGRIELSGVKEYWSTGSGMSKRMYSASIKYRFIANKSEYVGYRVDFGSAGSMGRSVDADARALVSRYPAGEEVRVYYNPENPQEAVLEPGFATRSWKYSLAALVFLSVGLTCFFYLPRLFRRREQIFEK